MSAPPGISHDPDILAISPARRPDPSTWRDPRLILGVVIVAVSVLLGAKLYAGADDTVSVWAARTDLRSGTTIRGSDLERRSVGFTDRQDADRYLSADSPLPAGATLQRDVGTGELLPRAALGEASSRSLVEVPVAVATEAVPATVRTGSVVDVWVTPDPAGKPGAARKGESVLVFDDVVVLAAPRPGTALGPSSTRQVIVGVDADQQRDLPSALARAARGTTVITKQG